MHSKWCYKICICLVIIGELESFRNYKGFSFILMKILSEKEALIFSKFLRLFDLLGYTKMAPLQHEQTPHIWG